MNERGHNAASQPDAIERNRFGHGAPVALPKEARIYVAGHQGLVGSAIRRRLEQSGHQNLVTRDHRAVDLTDQKAVSDLFRTTAPEYVFLAAAYVGGIHANATYPADFIRINLQIETNVIHAAHETCVRKLLFLGSSCIYPRLATQPITEESLLTGPLESTNEWYAIAKIAGIKLCQAYRHQYGFNAISLMPTNLYGPGDNFDLENSHVLPAMIRRFHEAKLAGEKSVAIWGSGKPRREFLHVDDLADAAVFLMQNYNDERIINVGVGQDIGIDELACLVARIVGFSGRIDHDLSRPDGTPRKLLDVGKLWSLGWRHKIGLEDGIRQTYHWYRDNG